MENCYVFLFNKECLKEKAFDQEYNDANAKFEDGILLYSTLDPKKLGDKLRENFITSPKSELIMYIITDLIMEDDNHMGIFPYRNDNITSVYSFMNDCLNDVFISPIPNLELKISIYSIAIYTPYINGHIPETQYKLIDEKQMLQNNFDDFTRRGLKELFIKNYYVEYEDHNVNNATIELSNLKNKLMLQKDKPNKIIENSNFILDNKIIHSDEIILKALPGLTSP